MVEKILNNTAPYGKIRASHEGSLHSSTLKHELIHCNMYVCIEMFEKNLKFLKCYKL